MKKETYVLSDTPHKLYSDGVKGYVQVDPKSVHGMHRESEFQVVGPNIDKDTKLKKDVI